MTTPGLAASRPFLRSIGLRWSLRWIGLSLVVLAFLPGQVEAKPGSKNPYDARIRTLGKAAEKLGSSPSAVLPVLEILAASEEASPEVYQKEIGRLLLSRRLSPAVKAYLARAEADRMARGGDRVAAERRYDELGFLRQFRVVGPFDNEGRAGFTKIQGPEGQQNEPVSLGAAYEGRERPVSWRLYPDIVRRGYVDLDTVLRPFENVCGIAETFVHAAKARPVVFWLGSGGANRLYVNGEKVLEDSVYRGPSPDRAAARVELRQGWNRVLVKTCVARGAWGFFLRVSETDLSPARELKVDPNGAAKQAAGGKGAAASVPTVLSGLEAAVSHDPKSARAHYELARFLVDTSAEDRVEGRSRQIAQRAVDLDDDVEHLLLAARTAETRAERMRFSDQADRVAGRDPRVIVYRAALVASGPDGDRALRMLEAVPPTTVEGMRALEIRSRLLSSLGLRRASAAALERLGELGGDAPAALDRRRLAAERHGHRATARKLSSAVLTADAERVDLRQSNVRLALERGQTDRAIEELDRILELRPADPRVLYYVAGIHDGMGDRERALSLARRVVDLMPDEAEAHVRLGDMLVRQGREEEAAQAYRAALVLRPQDAGARQSLERIRPTERPDEVYATSVEDILKRRRKDSGWPATVLHDLTVSTVYPNGLSSTFRQLAFQVHTAEGARSWDSYSVQYEPESQWVDVRSAKIYRADGKVVESLATTMRSLGDPRYRIYYDTRALVILLPDLEPGDTVELRYRVEDSSRRNAFNDYFGRLQFLQGFAPMARLEYVLVSPKERALYFNKPPLKGLRYEREENATQRIDRWTASDVPALRQEARMPGMTDVAPYLHVSTYQTWKDVGRWWWGLIEEQLHMDEALKRTVAEITKGAPDVRTKVRRIYAWVVKNTRYVGLEFGIHGFKPYRVTQIVQRGFGDCKDKASLLYVMLEEAGIDARIALVRTRQNGAIPSQPASLAVFDHAIAYVPALDLYLDGTAEFTGIEELPSMDQGVTVLRVGPDDVELARTPVLEADAHRHTREVTLALRPDGAGEVEVAEEIRGVGAPSIRSHFQAEGLRRERLERRVRALFAGVELGEASFENLDDYNTPARIRYTATAPTLAMRDGQLLRVAPAALHDLSRSLARSSSRRLPLDLSGRSSYREDRRVRLPRGWRVGELPEGGVAESRFGRLSIAVTREDHEVRARTELSILTDRVSADDYEAFRAWVEAADRLLRQRLVLAPGGSR